MDTKAKRPRMTPDIRLHVALVEGNNALFKQLLEDGADVEENKFTFTDNRRTRSSEVTFSILEVSPLHVAVLKDNIRAFRLLLKSKVNVNAMSVEPRLSALQLAAMKKRKDMVKELLRHGAVLPLDRCQLLESKGKTDTGPEFRERSASRALLDTFVKWKANSDTYLHECVQKRNIDQDFLTKLVAFGFNVNEVNSEKETALHSFCRRSIPETDVTVDLKTIDFFLKLGANLSARDSKGNTPLMVAIAEGYPRQFLVRLIPSQDEDLPAPGIDSDGYNAMAVCIKCYQYPDVEELLHQLLNTGVCLKDNSSRKQTLLLLTTVTKFYPEIKLKFLVKNRIIPDLRSFVKLLKHANPKLISAYLQFQGFSSAQVTGIYKTIGANPSKDIDMHEEGFLLLPFLEPLLVGNNLHPTLEDMIHFLGQGSLRAFQLLLKYHCKSDLKEHIPQALVLLGSRNFNSQHDLDLYLPLMRELIENFNVNPNHVDRISGESFLTKLLSNVYYGCCNSSKSFWLEAWFDYLLSRPEVDLDVQGVISFESNGRRRKAKVTPVTAALMNGHYVVAERLILLFADISDSSYALKEMMIRSGFSFSLMLMFYSGCDFSHHKWDESNVYCESQDELSRFKRWLLEKRRQVFPLQRLAGNVVRSLYGRDTHEFVNSLEFPDKVKSILFLDDIRSEHNLLFKR